VPYSSLNISPELTRKDQLDGRVSSAFANDNENIGMTGKKLS
jgi:hypothetical protein